MHFPKGMDVFAKLMFAGMALLPVAVHAEGIHTGNDAAAQAKADAAKGGRETAPSKTLREIEIKLLDKFSLQGEAAIKEVFGKTLPPALDTYLEKKDPAALAPDSILYVTALSDDAKKDLQKETQKILDEDKENPKEGKDRDERYLGLVKGLNMAVKSLFGQKPQNEDESKFEAAASSKKKDLKTSSEEFWNLAKMAADGITGKKKELRDRVNRSSLAGWMKQHCSSSNSDDVSKCEMLNKAYKWSYTDPETKKDYDVIDFRDKDQNQGRLFTGNTRDEIVSFWRDAKDKGLFGDMRPNQNSNPNPTKFYSYSPANGVTDNLPPGVKPPAPPVQVATTVSGNKQLQTLKDEMVGAVSSCTRCHGVNMEIGSGEILIQKGSNPPVSLATALEKMRSGRMGSITPGEIANFEQYVKKQSALLNRPEA